MKGLDTIPQTGEVRPTVRQQPATPTYTTLLRHRAMYTQTESSLYHLPRIAVALLAMACTVAVNIPSVRAQEEKKVNESSATDSKGAKSAVATFGAGCFWCTEAVFENLKGVTDVVSGYAGGKIPDPTYEQVCTGRTGHAEVCQIHYNPDEVKFVELLEVFWKTHDPTTLNQQGADKGTQYRSVVFYHDDEQKRIAEVYKNKLDESGAFPAKIVTEISPLPKFYVAEDYHQDYYRNNPGQGYCMAVVRPKVEKFKKVFKDKLNTDEKK
jgi:peptide-methionine (S)-S-oxide reductase